MNQDLSIVSLVMHASWVVQLVIAGLLGVSLASWSVIFAKLVGLAKVRSRNDQFEQEFWSGKNLNDLFQGASTRVDTAPMERLFASGMREFLKLRERRLDTTAQLDGARRAMRASLQRELGAPGGSCRNAPSAVATVATPFLSTVTVVKSPGTST